MHTHMQTQIILYSPTSSNAALDIIEPALFVSVTVTEYISDCCIIASVFESTPSMTPGCSWYSYCHTKHRITHEARIPCTPATTDIATKDIERTVNNTLQAIRRKKGQI